MYRARADPPNLPSGFWLWMMIHQPRDLKIDLAAEGFEIELAGDGHQAGD